jgi:heptosyltransferase II
MVEELKIQRENREGTDSEPVAASDFSLRTPVVVRSPNWLGDCVMAMPAVRNLKTFLGEKPLTVAAPAKIADLWRTCPFVDEVLTLEKPRSLWHASKQLREKKFESAVLLPNSLRAALEATFAAIPQIIGYPGHARAWLLTQLVTPAPFCYVRQHQHYYYSNLMEAIGATEQAGFPELRLPKTFEPVSVPTAKPQLTLCPGAEYGPAKRWPAPHYAALAKEFVEKRNARVVLLGAPKDIECGLLIKQLCPRVENRVGQTTLEQFMAELAHSRLVVCNDSGSMHLASALGVPTVAIFGSTEPRRTGPLGPRTTVLREHVLCSPCFRRECPFDFSCMLELTVEKVLPACLERWG